MVMKYLNGLALALALAGTILLLPNATRRLAADEEDKRFAVWRYEGGAKEVSLIVPTLFDNVKADIPPEHWDNVITADVDGVTIAFLIFDLKRAPRTIVTMDGKEHAQDNTIELLIGVLYSSGNPDDSGELFQFYALARLSNFAELVKAQRKMGLPATYVEEITYGIDVDEFTGFGTASLDVPWPASPFSVAAEFAWVNNSEIDAAAGEFFEGNHGLVKVKHSGKLALNPAQGTITVSCDEGILAQWLGGTSASGDGYFVAFNPVNHSLTAQIIRAKN